jgi:hypothetical protein
MYSYSVCISPPVVVSETGYYRCTNDESTVDSTPMVDVDSLPEQSQELGQMNDEIATKLDALAARQRERFQYETEQAPPDPEDETEDMG